MKQTRKYAAPRVTLASRCNTRGRALCGMVNSCGNLVKNQQY